MSGDPIPKTYREQGFAKPPRRGLRSASPKKRREPMPQAVVDEVAARSHGMCEARLPGCTSLAVSLHHRLRAGRINVATNILAVCPSCHTDSPAAIHRNPADAYEARFLLHPWDPEALAIRGLLTEEEG